MITTLKLNVSYEVLGLKKNFQGIYFGHGFFNAY
jgi:hypothetical protein